MIFKHADLADFADEFIPQINHGPQMTLTTCLIVHIVRVVFQKICLICMPYCLCVYLCNLDFFQSA